jgi:hypothetical protein
MCVCVCVFVFLCTYLPPGVGRKKGTENPGTITVDTCQKFSKLRPPIIKFIIIQLFYFSISIYVHIIYVHIHIYIYIHTCIYIYRGFR